MNVIASKRITNEFKEIKNCIELEVIDSHRFISIEIVDDDIFNLEVCFLGPKDSPYEEIINTISINISNKYPHEPPSIKFINNIYHPNIDAHGNICLDILKNKWTPVYTLRTVLMSIISLLSDANPDSPLNGDAAHTYTASQKSVIGRRTYQKLIMNYSNNIN